MKLPQNPSNDAFILKSSVSHSWSSQHMANNSVTQVNWPLPDERIKSTSNLAPHHYDHAWV